MDNGVTSIAVAKDALDAMLDAARLAHPKEACGILLGAGERIVAFREARNVHASPDTHFEIDPQALIDAHRAAREGGPEVVGYFHSHPAGEARPSTTDAALAAGDRMVWAIAGGEDVLFWRSDSTGFRPLSYALDSG